MFRVKGYKSADGYIECLQRTSSIVIFSYKALQQIYPNYFTLSSSVILKLFYINI